MDASGTASASRAPVHGAGTTRPRAQQAPRPVRLLQPGRWAPWPLAPPAPAVPPPAPRPLGSRWTSPSLGFLTNSTTGGPWRLLRRVVPRSKRDTVRETLASCKR